MVMTMRLYLIAGCRARVTHFSGNRDPNERFEYAIHRSPGNFWHSCPDVVKDLIGGRMIRTKGQGLQNHSPLNGEWQSVFATDLCEILQLEMGTISRGHNCNNIAADIKCQHQCSQGWNLCDRGRRSRPRRPNGKALISIHHGVLTTCKSIP
jgi:hypothetical protein